MFPPLRFLKSSNKIWLSEESILRKEIQENYFESPNFFEKYKKYTLGMLFFDENFSDFYQKKSIFAKTFYENEHFL